MSDEPKRGGERTWSRKFLEVSAGNYGAIVLSFVLNMLLTRRLGAEEFGRLALLVMGAQVLACLVTNWTVTALVRFGAQEFSREGTVARTFWTRLCVVAPWLAGSVAVVALAQEQAAAYFEVSSWAIWLLFGYFLLSSLLATLGSVFQACQQMQRYSVTLFMDKALAVVSVLALPAPLAQDAVMVIGCYVLSSLLVSVWAGAVLGRTFLRPISTSRAAVSELWRFSFPLIVSTWIGMIGTQWISYAIIKHYLAFSQLGLYSLANQVAGVVQQVTIISSSLLLPHFSVLVANGQLDEVRQQVERVAPYGFIGFALLLSAGALLAGPVVPMIFGSAFSESVPPLVILLAATMGLALFNTFMPLVSAHGRTWALTGITVVTAVINLAAALLLVPRYGINGAALATACTYGSAGLLMLWLVERALGVPVMRFAALGLPIVIVALCAALLDGPEFYLVGLASLAATTAVLVAAFRLFGRNDRAVLARMHLPMLIKSSLSRVFSAKAG